MRFRLGLVTGLATGYYLGARAGRQRYDQINRSLGKLRRSEAFEQATEMARTVVEDGLEKAKDTVDQLVGDKATEGDQPATGTTNSVTNGHGAQSETFTETTTAAGIILPTDPSAGSGYSSSR